MRLLTDRTALIQAVDKLCDKGGFAYTIGQAALLADQPNLKILVNAYPHFFTETEAKIRLVYVRRNDNLLEGQAKRKS
jgi:hypothetical protein